MNRIRSLFPGLIFLTAAAVRVQAQTAEAAQQANTTAAAAVTVMSAPPGTVSTDVIEYLVNSVLRLLGAESGENTLTHFAVAACFLVGAVLLRRVVTNLIFGRLKKLAAKTKTTLDDKLFPALEAPVATFIMLLGIFCAQKVLVLSPMHEQVGAYGATMAFSLVVFWGLFRALSALLDHGQEVASSRQMGLAAFMPWIKKTVLALFLVIGVLLVMQRLGFNVQALLAGLGIGGLAFALAAQDTIANLFGSIVVAIDQPFKQGEVVRIGAHTGTAEDIGLRSTKLRLIDRSLVILPNKLVSSEAIVNLSRFTARRVEQVLTLTYGTTAAQMEALTGEVRGLILQEAEVDPASVMVYFRDLNASSLDLWVVYATRQPDFQQHMALRQRLNLAFMRAVEARGLSFAFPTSTVHVASLPEKKA
jgi:MscS family membrane protein